MASGRRVFCRVLVGLAGLGLWASAARADCWVLASAPADCPHPEGCVRERVRCDATVSPGSGATIQSAWLGNYGAVSGGPYPASVDCAGGSCYVSGEGDFVFHCGESVNRQTVALMVRVCSMLGCADNNVAHYDGPSTCWPECRLSGPHAGDGCCDLARNRPDNSNPDCAPFDVPGLRRACCRPPGAVPPVVDPTHPPTGHPLPGPKGWCDQCSGGGGGGGGCQSDADCGPGQKCCGGACVQGTSCAPPPPSGFNVVIAVYGSEGHRWDVRLKQGKVRVPMSFRLWDPAAGRYVYETTADGAAPPTVPCRNRRGKVLDPVLACWSRPWLVPDYDENPTGVVRTHRIHLDGPRTLYVQPECGVEFNAVLNPAKLRARFREPPITFDPERDLKLGLKLDMDASCPVRQAVCADGRPCGRCPNGRWPEMDGSCIGRGTPTGTDCADGSACEAACLYVIDLTDVYERRETVSWCYEDTRKDRACRRPGDPSSCVSTKANAVDDWRASSPFCWEQTVPNPRRGAPAQGIGRPASFKDPPNCTLETDGCWAFDDKTCGPAGARGSRRP